MKQIQKIMTIPCRQHGFTDITGMVKRQLQEARLYTGLINLFIKDIGCSISIQENANPDTHNDMEILITHTAPDEHKSSDSVRETHDAHEHTRMALTNNSLTIPIQNGRLVLGTWQAISLYEHHSHAKNRRVFFHAIGS